MEKSRCPWCANSNNPLMIEYHDKEWGVEVHDDRKHFEFIVLDSFQAGLSWNTIINKRENFRNAFDNFIPEVIAEYSPGKIELLMQDAGIIRNRLKVAGTVKNAKAFLAIVEKHGSFDKYIWDLIGKPVDNKVKDAKSIPASTPLSDKVSKALKKEGFTFVGTTIVYAYMQAAGMVNDHTIDCFRYAELKG